MKAVGNLAASCSRGMQALVTTRTDGPSSNPSSLPLLSLSQRELRGRCKESDHLSMLATSAYVPHY